MRSGREGDSESGKTWTALAKAMLRSVLTDRLELLEAALDVYAEGVVGGGRILYIQFVIK